MTDRVEADYLVETALDPLAAAEVMAGEQSSGTFVAVQRETHELRRRAAATIDNLEVLDTVSEPSLPGGAPTEGRPIRRALVTISWPLENIGPSLPNAMTMVAGNLFELQQISGLRILDVRFPRAIGDAYPGPSFAIEGTRRLCGVPRGPIIGTIVKPSVGLSPADTAAVVHELAWAGIDFIKDDELQCDGPSCPFDERARAVMDVINRHADRTGKKVMYAFNITGEFDQMRRRHDLVLELGGTCVMASLNSVGLVGIIELAKFRDLPIHAHRNGWGYLSRAPMLGWSYIAWQKFWRLAGADHMHVNGLSNKFAEDDGSVVSSALACLTPMFDEKPCIVMPVVSSGQTAIQPAKTYERLGSADLIYAAGGGIMGHPDGIAAGVQSLRDAWHAAEQGIPKETYAADHPALKRALEAFGR